MIRYSCPKCGVNLKSAEDKAGARTACPRCGEHVTVPGSQPAAAREAEGQEPAAKGKTAAPGKKPVALYAGIGVAILAVVGVGVAMVSMSSGSKTAGSMSTAQFSGNVPPPRKTVAKPAPAKPAKKSGDEEVADASKPKPSEEAEAIPNRKAKNSASDAAMPSKPTAPKAEESPSEPTAPGRYAREDTGETSLSARQLYDQLLKSTAYVEIDLDTGTGAVSGSASLIDRKNKLLLTNQHVTDAASQGKLFVIFPIYEKGQLIVEKDAYKKAIKSHADMVIPGWVEYQDKKADLALIRLGGLPEHNTPIHLAKDSAGPGQMMYALGCPGSAPALWIQSTGPARSYPHHMKWTTASLDEKTTTDREAIMIESQSPVNHGDSGGPVVNDRGELIAVTQGGVKEANLLNVFIDVQEVKKFLSGYYQSKHIPQPEETTPTIQVARDMPSLIHALHDHGPDRRAWACDQLATMGAEAKNAVPDLVELLQDKDDIVRMKGLSALSEIGFITQGDLPKIIDALKDPKSDVRLNAILVIRHMGEEADSAVPGLTVRLKDDSPDVREQAAKTLGNLGGLAISAVPALAEALQHRDKKHEVRQEAALAIGNILAAGNMQSADPTAAAVGAGALEAGQRDPIREVRLSSLQGLEKMGPNGKTAVAQVLKSLKEKDREMRAQAVVTLGAIGPDAKDAVVPLAQIVVDDKELRVPAAQALGKIKKPAVLVLTKLILNSNVQVRRVCIEALGDIGPDAGPLAARQLSVLFQKETDHTNSDLIREAIKKILEK
jgi:HEAT repeat protein/S1-C subfamily serine protease